MHGGSPKIADTAAQDIRLPPPSAARRRLVGGALVVGVLVAAWVLGPAVQRWATTTVSISATRLRTATVTRGDLVRDVSVQGRVIAAVRPTLYASAAGVITLRVEAGAAVTVGEVLAEVDSPELTNELRQAQSSLEQQTIELERQRIESRQQTLEKQKSADLADVALVAARREKRRADQAHERGVIPAIDFEKAQDDLRNAELAYNHATADARLFKERLAFEIKASELATQRQQLLVDELQRQVDALSIHSPVNGIVGDLLVQQKAAVSRDTPVMSVVDLSRFEIDAQVPESYADDLAIGMQTEVMIGNGAYAGQLVAISPEIVDNQVSTRIRFVGETPENIRQNQRLTTRILLEDHPNVLMLPRGQFLDNSGGRFAYVLTGDGLARRRPIQIGARSLGAVEVTGGLDEGDTVIVSGTDQFRGADVIQINN